MRHIVATLVALSLFGGAEIANAAALTFTGTTTSTGPGVPPLAPLVWSVSADSESVYALELTPQSITPSSETIWELNNISVAVDTNSFDGSDEWKVEFSFDLSSLSGNAVQVSNAFFAPTGSPDLSFDAIINGVGTASHVFQFETLQPANFINLAVVSDAASFVVTLGMVFTDDGIPDLPIFTGTLTGNIIFIPIPPAFWLVGSALGILGWFKRRQTA